MQTESPITGRELAQVGIVVKDVKETAKKLEEFFGIGPFQILDPDYTDQTLYGKPTKFKMRIGLVKVGSVQIELIQPLSGGAVYEEFIRRKGYGLHHLAFRTDNMEQSVKQMEAKGVKVIQTSRRPGVNWLYLATEKETNVVFELIQWG
jgi:methylmalonyl-CoA/ethylmalonyl-CoA epimerase